MAKKCVTKVRKTTTGKGKKGSTWQGCYTEKSKAKPKAKPKKKVPAVELPKLRKSGQGVRGPSGRMYYVGEAGQVRPEAPRLQEQASPFGAAPGGIAAQPRSEHGGLRPVPSKPLWSTSGRQEQRRRGVLG